MTNNAFYFILKVILVLKIFKFSLDFFGYRVNFWLGKFQIYDVKNWYRKNYKYTYCQISQVKQSNHEICSVNSENIM